MIKKEKRTLFLVMRVVSEPHEINTIIIIIMLNKWMRQNDAMTRTLDHIYFENDSITLLTVDRSVYVVFSLCFVFYRVTIEPLGIDLVGDRFINISLSTFSKKKKKLYRLASNSIPSQF